MADQAKVYECADVNASRDKVIKIRLANKKSGEVEKSMKKVRENYRYSLI
ncbi:hypothetical protein [Paraglaciecola sp. 20A4]|nr:hypothetical protein [Paraglaciecola sp. 20A4]